MKVLQINIFGNLSTGRIATDLHRVLIEKGHEGCVAFARNSIAEDVPYIKIGKKWDVLLHGILTRITDKTGFYSRKATIKLIKQIEEYQPDIIHLHNIHGYYINIEILFQYLKEKKIPVVWTLHDCWSYTGHCCYYSMVKCERWKEGCFSCPQKKAYPASFIWDNSKWNYLKKKELFSGTNMTLVPVSNWLANEVKMSYMNEFPIEMIYNGIDLEAFKPSDSDFRGKYNLKDKKIVLGVASTWDVRKGLKDFIHLSTMLEEDYQIVLVGIKDEKEIPDNIITIERTNSLKELAEIYTAADIFFNASVEETFGLPTIEAIACGTPVIVYNATALPEIVNDKCGYVVEPHDLEKVKQYVEIICNEHIFSTSSLVDYAKRFSKTLTYEKYIDLYERITKEVKE